MAKQRDYRAEYARRIARGIARGFSRSQARGHARERAGELPIREVKRIAEPPKHVGGIDRQYRIFSNQKNFKHSVHYTYSVAIPRNPITGLHDKQTAYNAYREMRQRLQGKRGFVQVSALGFFSQYDDEDEPRWISLPAEYPEELPANLGGLFPHFREIQEIQFTLIVPKGKK